MSNLHSKVEQDCQIATGCNALKMILKPLKKDLGGFSATRLLPVRACRSVGPWVFFDHMGPANFDAGKGIDVRPHPHIGLATVTYLFEGEMLHRDSLGTTQVIRPGEINLMVAGSGIVHSERQPEEVKARPHSVNGLQLWLALPTELEQTDAAFYHYDSQDIPELIHSGVPVRVLMGSACGVSSPVKTLSETLYIEAQLEPGQSLKVPEATERAIYVVEGALEIGDQQVQQHEMAVLDALPNVSISASIHSKIAVIGGEPLGQRFIEWNFVASRKELIEKAKADWVAGLFGKIPDDNIEYIPLPKIKR